MHTMQGVHLTVYPLFVDISRFDGFK